MVECGQLAVPSRTSIFCPRLEFDRPAICVSRPKDVFCVLELICPVRALMVVVRACCFSPVQEFLSVAVVGDVFRLRGTEGYRVKCSTFAAGAATAATRAAGASAEGAAAAAAAALATATAAEATTTTSGLEKYGGAPFDVHI